MRKPLLLHAVALALLCLPTAGGAEEESAPTAFDLGRATVVASPGVPRAMHPFLPGGKAPRKLGWPLPAGPLLVIGLPASDPTARQIADAFHLSADPADLAGGYRLWAWHDGTRPIAFLFGSDPAAVYAARFAFDTVASARRSDPGQRSLDFERPNEEAGLFVRAGMHAERPRYGMRAFAPGAALPAEPAATVAGARGNRLWLEPAALGRERTVAALRELTDQGVTPVIVARVRVRMGVGGNEGDKLEITEPGDLTVWQREFGIRHFALIFGLPHPPLAEIGEDYAEKERRSATRLATQLRMGGLDELVVVPLCRSDADAASRAGPPPDLRAIPEAVIAWSGPLAHSIRITKEDAERRVRAAGVPVVLYDTWAAPFDGVTTHIPRLPSGRDPALHEILAGVVVVGARGTGTNLASAWRPVEEERFGPAVLGPLLPLAASDPHAFMVRSAAALERQASEDMGLVGWMRPVARSLRRSAARIAAGTPALRIPRVPQRVVMDGRIDEPPWAFAKAVPLAQDGASVLVLADGTFLRLALRVQKEAVGDRPFLLVLRLGTAAPDVSWDIEMCAEHAQILVDARGTVQPSPAHVTAAWHESATQYAAEIAFDRYALHGDPVPTRCFDLTVSWGSTRLWPPAAAKAATGLLVATP